MRLSAAYEQMIPYFARKSNTFMQKCRNSVKNQKIMSSLIKSSDLFNISCDIYHLDRMEHHISLLADWFIPVVILLWSPMAGLGAIIREDVLVWIAAAVISAAMIVFSIVRAKKLRDGNE